MTAIASWSITDPSTWVWTDPEQVLAITSVITVALVAVGGVIAFVQLRHAQKGRIEQQRPFVVIDVFGSRASLFRIEIKNVGKTIARDVSFSFDPPLTSTLDSQSKRIENIPILAKGLPSLAPGKRHTFLLDNARKRKPDEYPESYKVTVKYEGYEGTNYTEQLIVDLGAYLSTPDLVERDIHDVWHSLEKMNKSLHGIHEALLNLIPKPQNKHFPPLPKAAPSPEVIEGPPTSIDGTGFPDSRGDTRDSEESSQEDPRPGA